MPVELNDRTASPAATTVGACAEALLALIGRSEDELVVSLVDDQEIRRLNRDYRGKDRATDVLSFSQLEGEELIATPEQGAALGDVVISSQTAAQQAAAGGWTLEEELARLLLHGLLHLLGYDHEASAAEEARMQAEEHRLAVALHQRGLPCALEEPS